MSVKSSKKDYKKILNSSTLLRSSVLTQNPLKPQDSQRRLSSMIKIGAMKVFKLPKQETISRDLKVRRAVETKQRQFDRPKSLESVFSFDLNEDQQDSNKVISLDIHGRKRKYRVKTKILKPLCMALTKIFNAEEFSGKTELTDVELRLIFIFLKKRFGVSFLGSGVQRKPNNPSVKILNLYAKTIFLLESKKREEENLKFVYKHTLKYLKSQFYEQHRLRYNKDSELVFYNFYFKDFAQQEQKPLKEFFDPLNQKNDSAKPTKTLSVMHLKAVFACEKFRRAFFDYLRTGFKKDYQSSVYKKIEKIFSGLERKLDSEGSVEKRIEEFISGFKEKKRIKFPWCRKEIDSAVFSFIKRVERISK